MSALSIMITEYLSRLRLLYFAKQCLVIFCIFLLGALLADLLLRDGESWVRRSILAFPLGISAFVITAYAMLVAGIPYNTATVIAAFVIEAVAAVFLNRKSFAALDIKKSGKYVLIAAGVAVITAAVSSSGLVPVSITNDTLYYFKRYPDSIVFFGGLRDQFDCWLTDTGLGIVCVDTLPPLFGFGETFGIREFFHIDFVAFFAMCIYERASKNLEKKGAIVATVLITGVLATATPFVILGHWGLANMYFMEMFFIATYTSVDVEDSIGAKSVLLLALSLLRIEGTLFAVWLVLCICAYRKIGKKLALFVVLPMTVLFGTYCLRVFTQFNLQDNIYLFLTPKKAILLVSVIAATGIYISFIEPVLPEGIHRYLPCIYICGAICGNLLMLVRDSGLYLGNLRTFYANLFGQSGWGIMPHFAIAMFVLLIAEYLIRFRKNKTTPGTSDRFNMTIVAGFILITIAASYGRGDALSGYVGDSGNRVLLQVVPLVVLMYAELTLGLLNSRKTESIQR